MSVREKLYKHLDNVKDESLLESYYSLLLAMSSNDQFTLLKNLSKEQKEELLKSTDESYDDSNLIEHDTVKNLIKNGYVSGLQSPELVEGFVSP